MLQFIDTQITVKVEYVATVLSEGKQRVCWNIEIKCPFSKKKIILCNVTL